MNFVLSIGLIFLLALSLAWIFNKIKLPKLIAYLLIGIILGPYVLNLISPEILNISSELREIALVIIIIKAGLSLDIQDLKKVGRPAFLLSFLPATFEILAYTLIAPYILGINHLEGAIMGSVLGAVSPAVVVPMMVKLMDERYGTEKRIPHLMLAGASLDDVYTIVLFQSFIGMAGGTNLSLKTFISIPVSIILGLALGYVVGVLLSYIFSLIFKKNNETENVFKLLLILTFALLLKSLEKILKAYVPVSGLLAVMAMSMVIAKRQPLKERDNLKDKFGKLWIPSELILFVLVGASVNLGYTAKAGGSAVAMIFIALAIRSVAVLLAVAGTNLTWKERLFAIFSYMPKATVQAAIGGIALSLGLPCGNIVLSVAVLSILITAPLGSILMNLTYKKLLEHEDEKPKQLETSSN